MQKYFYVETDKPALSYKCGEKMVFTVWARNNIEPCACPYVEWTLDGDDGKRSHGLGEIRKDRPLVLETDCARAGFVHLHCVAKQPDGGDDAGFDVFDGGAGAQVDDIKYCDEIPDDFDGYWAEIEQSIADFTPDTVECVPVTASVPDGFECYDVKLTTPIEGMLASGYLCKPKSNDRMKIKIIFMGYSVVGADIICEDNVINFCVNAHGIENGVPKLILEQRYKQLSGYGFNSDENASPYTTYWRNMMIRNLSAAKWLSTYPQWDGCDYISQGGSQGAFQATAVAAHCNSITYLDLWIPWLCNLSAENNGYLGGWRPKFAEGLRYFDTAAQATRVKCPTKIVAYLGDYVCPPSTVMALYNNLTVNKSLDFIQGGTHGYRPPQRMAFALRFDPENPTGEIKCGRYRHFKGKEYEVIGTALNSETLETQVVYRALYGARDIWVRPACMWSELVEHEGKRVRRFEFIGE